MERAHRSSRVPDTRWTQATRLQHRHARPLRHGGRVSAGALSDCCATAARVLRECCANTDVQKSINKSIQYILTQKPIFNKNSINEFIIRCPNISNKLKEILLEYSNNADVHSIYNITFEELLISVISLIEHPNNKCKEEIYKVLEQEMSDSICKCFTGRMSRLVNCLNGFDNNISVTISSNEQLSTIVLLIKEKLGLAYTVEEHKRLLELEMKDREYTEEVIQEWLTYLD